MLFIDKTRHVNDDMKKIKPAKKIKAAHKN